MDQLLGGRRVLDLTDHRGETGPYALADLGATVHKVVPAGFDGRDGTGDDLTHRTYSANKTVEHLTGAADADRARLLALAADHELVFDAWPDGLLAAHGIDDDDLTAVNPCVVRTLVSPFGTDGPRAHQPASELTVAALGGPVRLQGVADRAPVHLSVPQVWRHAGVEAAVAALVAHRRMRLTGEAQFVDVSAQSVMTWTMLNAMEAHAVQGRDFERNGSELRLSIDVQLRQETADGWTICVPTGRIMPAVVDWLVEDGIVDEAWRRVDWATYDHRVISGEVVEYPMVEVMGAVAELCRRYPKYELFERGLVRGATFAPLNDVHDLLAFPHLEARGFWTEGEADRVPGAFYRLDGTRPTVARTAGSVPVPTGDEAGPTPADAVQVASGPGVGRDDERDDEHGDGDGGGGVVLPWSGLKVADFSWIGVGPITAKSFADHGATVVRVESEEHIDGLRLQPPFADGEAGINRSHFFGTFNTSKRSLSLDLKSEAGIEAARRLVDWADVVIESFTPGTMEGLGLGYDVVSATNPSLVMVSTNLLGDGSHVSCMAGYGYHAAAVAGFQDLVGWPDLPPDGPWIAYTDTIGPRFITTALLAALDRRERTGEGCHLEAAQLETALQFLAPELIRLQRHGTAPTRRGNRGDGVAPQGVYPTRGHDQWLALSVSDDDRWSALVDLLGRPDWATDPALATVEGRLANHDELDERLGAWTATHDGPDLEARLAGAGVAAGVVQSSRQLPDDPQYRHRRFYRTLTHAEVGDRPYAGHQYRIRGYDHGPRWAPPCLGDDSFAVLTDLVGLDPDEVADLAARGALG